MAYESEMELELEEELGGVGEFEQHEGEQHEWEHHELSHEFEGEQFFKRIFRGIGRFVRRAAPFLKTIARVAAPIVGTAIGGPFGAVLGRVASSALGEEEFEQHEWEQHELAHEFEQHEFEHPETAHEFEQHEFEHPETAHEFEQHEFEHHELAHEFEHPEMAHEFEHHEFEQHESLHEVAHEISHHEVSHHEALAEMMAEMAAHEHHEGQAEAMIGAAVVTVLSPRDRRALRRLLPHLVRGAAVLTRILRRRRATRPAVRAVPTIMRRTVRNLKRQAAAGKPITRRAAGRAAATEVRRVLGSPSACAAAIRQNVRSVRRARTPSGMGC
jgi:hypothetical protein